MALNSNSAQSSNNASALADVRNTLLAAVFMAAESAANSSAEQVLYAVSALVNASSLGVAAPVAVGLVGPGLQTLAAVSFLAAAGLNASSVAVERLANATAALVNAGDAAGALTSVDVTRAVAVFSAVAESAEAVVSAGTVADTVIFGLSMLVSSPVASAAAASAQSNSAAAVFSGAGAAVASLTGALASATLANCAAVPGASRSVSSPRISIAVFCDVGGSAATEAPFADGLSIPGSDARVDPLPPATFGGDNASVALSASLVELGFDPHGDGGTNRKVVRLEFTDGASGKVIPLAGLLQPIALQVPTPVRAPGDNGSAGVAAYWNASRGSYASDGVVAGPNPVPPGASWAWRDGFQATCRADLVVAWALTLPGCHEQFLNCSDDWGRTLAAPLDPEQAVGGAVVRCGAADVGLLRVYTGHACPLWRHNATGKSNATTISDCLWSVPEQLFVGAACIYSNITRLMTTHTTDFSVLQVPRVAVASPSDMAALTPGVLARLSPLIATLAAMFGAMHVLGLALNARDQHDMASVKRRVCSRALGCTHADGLHLWRFTQAPLAPGAVVGAVQGSAVNFASLIGVPFGRLALAIPEDLFGGLPPKLCLGRAHGISARALRKHHAQLLRAVSFGHAEVVDDEAAATSAEKMQFMKDDDDIERAATNGSLALKSRFDALVLQLRDGAPAAAGAGQPVTAQAEPAERRKSDEEDLCAICCEPIILGAGRSIIVAGCGHSFHIDCTQRASSHGHLSCALCRAPVDVLQPPWLMLPAVEVQQRAPPPASSLKVTDLVSAVLLSIRLFKQSEDEEPAAFVDDGTTPPSKAAAIVRQDSVASLQIGNRLLLQDLENVSATANEVPARPGPIPPPVTAAVTNEVELDSLVSHTPAAGTPAAENSLPSLDARDDGLPPHAPPDLLQLSSTALMHAYLISWCLASSEETAANQLRYIELLTACGLDPGGVRFMRLFAIYKEALMGHLYRPADWLPRARLLRCVLLYDERSGWEPSDALAAVLQATQRGSAADPNEPTPWRGLQVVRDAVQNVLSTFALGQSSGESTLVMAENAYEARRRDAARRLSARRSVPVGVAPAPPESPREAEEGPTPRFSAPLSPLSPARFDDDPLHFSGSAIAHAVPEELLERCGGDTAAAGRAWATACACAFLESQRAGWLTSAFSSRDAPRSLVDDAHAQLQRAIGCSDEDELLHEVMADARQQVALWAARADLLITRSRGVHLRSRVYVLCEAQRKLLALVNALLSQSATLTLFLSVYCVGGRRWHGGMLLVSSMLAMLLVQIWLHWSRAKLCCANVRAALGCAGDASAGDCRGYAGLCADLTATYFPHVAAALVDSPFATSMPACTAFPDPESGHHIFLAGLIGAAVALPFSALVGTMWSLSLATDARQIHGRTRLLTWSLHWRALLGAFDWRFAKLRGGRRSAALHRRLAGWWATGFFTDVFVCFADLVIKLATRLKLADADDETPSVEDAAFFDAFTARCRAAGFAALYLIWALFAWLVLTYGRLVLDLMGPAEATNFTRSWAASVGLAQLADLRAFLLMTLQALFLTALLDALWVLPNRNWLETQIDFVSVQATALGSWAQRVAAYARHMKAVK